MFLLQDQILSKGPVINYGEGGGALDLTQELEVLAILKGVAKSSTI